MTDRPDRPDRPDKPETGPYDVSKPPEWYAAQGQRKPLNPMELAGMTAFERHSAYGDALLNAAPRPATRVPAVEHPERVVVITADDYAKLPERFVDSLRAQQQRTIPHTPQRWNIEMNGDDQIIEKADDGEWLRAEDVLPLLARLGDRDQLRDGLGRLAQQLTAAEAQVERLTALLLELRDMWRALSQQDAAWLESLNEAAARKEPGGQ